MSGDAVIKTLRARAPKGAATGERLELSDRVMTMTVEDDEKKPDKLQLVLNNADLSLFDSPRFRKGVILDASWGWPGNMAPEREFVIEKVSGGRIMKIEAKGKESILHKRVKSRAFKGMRRSEVVSEIADEYGFSTEFVQYTPDLQEQITQARMTDAQLVISLARREGYEWFIDYDGWHWHERQLQQKPILHLTYYAPDPMDPNRGNVFDFNVEEAVEAGKPGLVRVEGFDLLTKKKYSEVASNATQRATLAPIQDTYGPDDPSAAGEPLIEQLVTELVLPSVERTAKQAKRFAEGAWKRAQVAQVKMTVSMWGVPALVAKSVILIDGIGPTLSGLYYVTNAKHKTAAPYTLTLKVSRDGKTRANQPQKEKLPGQGDGVPSGGTLNTQEPLLAGEPAPQPVINPDTGLLEVEYRARSRHFVIRNTA